ncbi:hypothetical protein J6590_102863 [Homalodisca vitripennis]|nr:hypothetical protein J6590_102863 [Homalodisca vitripennis]
MSTTFDSDLNLFIDELEHFYEDIECSKTCIFLGDINLDLLRTTEHKDRYLNCLEGAGLKQCIDKPTRVTDDRVSCLDHIFVRHFNMDHVRAAVVHTDITDHYSTGLTISVSRDITTTDSDNTPRSYIDYTLLTDSGSCRLGSRVELR